MIADFEAVFENGLFRPLSPLPLSENQKVTLSITSESESLDIARFVIPADRWDEFCAALDAPAKVIPTLRKLLSEPGVFDGPNTAAH